MTLRKYILPALASAGLLLYSCQTQVRESSQEQVTASSADAATFQYVADKFADLQVLRYRVPDWESLTAQQKELAYYLSQAALSGRDIIWDQNYKHNLRIRKTLEAITENYKGDRSGEEFKQFMTYAKRVWFSNGIHHHYSTRKFIPEFSQAYFTRLVRGVQPEQLPLLPGESVENFLQTMTPILFDPNLDGKRVNQEDGADLLASSANNYYEGVTQQQAEAYYKNLINPNETRPISYGLNSKLIMKDGQVIEQTYKIGGMYGPAIQQIVNWLNKAVTVAENEQQATALRRLIEFYQTGDLRKFDEYNIAWVADTASRVDVVNGFIEVYGDAIGYRGAYESVVSFKDLEATKRIKAIGDQAQWFEDNSPLLPAHKKKKVTGITGKVITVVTEAGDAAPATPIGINLPNANWIRQEYGSKSVSLGNIVEAYDHVKSSGSALEEFAFSAEEIQRTRTHGTLAGFLHTDMHEVIGHASGQINPGVGTPKETLKSYASTLEEARADLVALYFLMDQKLIDIGVMPSLEVGMTEYDSYIRNGMLTQLNRLELGENLEEAHMRNRQLVASWAYEKGRAGNVIERVNRGGKTYFVVRDYNKLRSLFGELLREIQRITSEGDYAAGRNLVETYGVKVDPQLHKEVKERYARLNEAPYSGFIQPRLVPVTRRNRITDVKIEYPEDFVQQMLEYGKQHSHLPLYN